MGLDYSSGLDLSCPIGLVGLFGLVGVIVGWIFLGSSEDSP